MGSVDILDQYQAVLQRRFRPNSATESLTHTGTHAQQESSLTLSIVFGADVLAAYEWLLCYLCVESHHKVEQELSIKKVSLSLNGDCIAFPCVYCAEWFHCQGGQPSFLLPYPQSCLPGGTPFLA